MLRGDGSERGRFGSSLAVLPDINADGLNDLAVGAPLEDNGHGSIYLFHGESMGSMGLTFSQVTDMKKKTTTTKTHFAHLQLCCKVLKVFLVFGGVFFINREFLALEV